MELKEFLGSRASKCKKRLEAIGARIDEIAKINETSKDEAELKAVGDELAELQAEKAELEAELKEIEAQMEALEKPEAPAEDPKEETPFVGVEGDAPINPERKNFLVFETRNGGKQMEKENKETRAKAFAETGKMSMSNAEARAVLVKGGTIVTPTDVNGIVDTFNKVSSIVDLVKVVGCEGMGANKVAYQKNVPTAETQTEGEAVTGADPEFGFVEIRPESVQTFSLISKQVRKQTPLDYEGKVSESAETALKVKAGNIITKAIVSSALIAKPSDLTITAIDDKTLRKIAFNYGGDEGVYGNAVLFLTKADLIAFGDVRGTSNKNPVYEITPDTANPNTGTIKDGGLSVRYCLDSHLVSLANAEQGAVAMFYGQPENCELDLFSDYEIAVSEDFAFDKNMLAIRGDVELGSAVIKQDGFIAVTKGA